MAKMKKRKINLAKSLKGAKTEKTVEAVYWSAFLNEYPSNMTAPYRSDGLLVHKDISAIMEFKYDLDLRDSFQQATVIIQALFYLKQMENAGEPLPKCILIGDVNECFVVPTSQVSQYLKLDINWNIAPSSAAKKNQKLVREISKNVDIEPFIYDVDKYFDILSVIEKMKNISQDKPYAISITKKNIVEIFKRFERDVVREKKYKLKDIFRSDKDESSRISELADLFMTCLTAPDDVYLHPKKKNTMIVRGSDLKVNAKNFRAFQSQFKTEYTPAELEDITANKDRILADTHRRRTGAFFTPDIWVAEAHKMIAEQFGENWKEEYVVWDCACGTANLTRGYKFKELYISTIDQSDINTVKDCGYNQEATAFQYDFLDEVGIDRVPESLRKAFEDGKKVLFFINPPYGTSCGGGAGTEHKTDVAKTVLNEIMKQNKIGSSSQQLYAQFLYKISCVQKKYNKDIEIGLFAPPLFMSGPSFENFRKIFYSNFEFKDGMLFKASHFADVKSKWGISFTIWENK